MEINEHQVSDGLLPYRVPTKELDTVFYHNDSGERASSLDGA